MKILIVEDDFWQSNEMKGWLEDTGYTVLGTAKSGEEALKIIDKETPDLMIVDIELKGRLNNGIKLMSKVLQKNKLAFLYLTSDSRPNYYEEARATNPQAYLTKAEVSTKASLLRNVDLALHSYAVTSANKPLPPMVDDSIFALDTSDMYVKIPIKDICWFEAQGSYTCIQTLGKKRYTVSKNLSTLMAKTQISSMLRINQSYAVNLYNVTAFKGKSIQVGGETVVKSISDKYCQNFEQYFNKV